MYLVLSVRFRYERGGGLNCAHTSARRVRDNSRPPAGASARPAFAAAPKGQNPPLAHK